VAVNDIETQGTNMINPIPHFSRQPFTVDACASPVPEAIFGQYVL